VQADAVQKVASAEEVVALPDVALVIFPGSDTPGVCGSNDLKSISGFSVWSRAT
jgi:hypothetical protein